MTPETLTIDPPIVVGALTFVRWIEGHTYETDAGATYYSGAAEPSQEDAEDCVANPRVLERILNDAEAEALLDSILDGWAREWGYTSAARCVTYRGSSNPKFDAEADAMFAARDALWTATAAAPEDPETPQFTEANIRAFADTFKPTRPAL